MHNNAYRRLIDIGLALSAERDIDKLLERILREAKELANAEAGSLYRKTERNTLRFEIVLNDSLNFQQGGSSGENVTMPDVPLKTISGEDNLSHVASRAAITGKTVVVEDAYVSSDFDFSGTRKFDELTGYRSVSFLTIPLKTAADEVMGVLQLINTRNEDEQIRQFPDDVRLQVEALTSLASVALENRYLLDEQEELKRELEKEVDTRTRELQQALDKLSEAHNILKELTTIDAVTGIRNRQYFEEVFDQEWRRALRQNYDLSMMVVDIDHFKKVNDTYGHMAGDECLAGVARCIDNMFNRPSDVVARYGGEEFVVILPYVGRTNALQLGEVIRKEIESTSFPADGHSLGVTVSVGIASMVPSDGDHPRKLIGLADEALYKAKSEGRNRVCGSG